MSSLELPPLRATIMPSSKVIPPGEEAEVLVMFNPGPSEMTLCETNRALLALVKVTFGDEILRQWMIKSGVKSHSLVKKFSDINVADIHQKLIQDESEYD